MQTRVQPPENSGNNDRNWFGFALAAPLMLTLLRGIDPPSIFDTFGPDAERLESVWWLMFWMAVPCYAITLGLLIYAVYRSRKRDRSIDPREIHHSSLLFGGGIVLPVLVIAPLAIVTVIVGEELTTGDEEENVLIEVVGHQFWWEINYPEYGVTTANELHLPVDTRVQVRVTSADVVHSFWIPQLHGKIDLVPGQTNRIWLEANELGELRGHCAEFCGTQHTNMRMLAIVQEQDEFDEWLDAQAQPAEQVTDPVIREGQQTFLGSACVYCHTVRGHNQPALTGEVGPDLTHIASRRELAAGTVLNTRGNLAAWIVDPQSLKPYAHMPGVDLDSESLHALVTYLESLE